MIVAVIIAFLLGAAVMWVGMVTVMAKPIIEKRVYALLKPPKTEEKQV
jgi:hypothetical protein